MLLVKLLVIVLLGFIVVSLFSGLYFLVKDKGQTNRTANALTVRIGLSIVAIVIIMIAGATGLIELNSNPMSGDPPRQAAPETATGAAGDAAVEESGGSGRRRE